ncbi:MAG: DUF4268 domain-containing protein [Planctomycetota bacterium]|nr:MAG: DUF4268 domain-containing protein [Planctomycetota bacterium]
MGQLLTYAAGLDAVTIVWVAQRFTEEHRAALDWLNEKTDEDVNFFGLEIELWKIGGSEKAPKFNIVSKPNDWTRTVKTTAAKTELTPTKKQLLDYWTGLTEFMQNNGSHIRMPKPAPKHWLIFSVGRNNFQIYTRASNQKQEIGVYLRVSGPNRLEYFHALEKQYRQEADQAVGMTLDWRRLLEGKESHIELYYKCDPFDKSDWPNQFQWLSNAVEKLHAYFSPIIKQLDISELDEIEQE